MQLKQKSHSIAAAGTVIAMLLLFLFLWLVRLSTPQQEEEEGVEIAFGNTENAGAGVSPETIVPSQAAAPQVASTAPSENDLMTQEDEEALALARQREQEEKARKMAEDEAKRIAKEQAEKAEAERLAKEKALAEQKAKEQAAIAKADKMGSLFGNNASGAQGSGDTQGEGQKGNPVGHGTSGGDSWNLTNRNIKGALPKPQKDFKQDGKVVVEIRVDEKGNVVSARVTTGTNVSDATTQQLAVEAAKKAKFSESDQSVQIGTITYNFRSR